MKKLAVFLLLLSLSCFVKAAGQYDANALFNWAETNFPEHFSPSGTTTQIQGDSYYRDYTQSQTKLITRGEDVYYEAPGSNGQIWVGKLSDFITPITQIYFKGKVAENDINFECGYKDEVQLPEATPLRGDRYIISDTGHIISSEEYYALGVEADVYKFAYSVQGNINQILSSLGLLNVVIPRTENGLQESTITQRALEHTDSEDKYFTEVTGTLPNFQMKFNGQMLAVTDLAGVPAEEVKAILLRGENNMADSVEKGEYTDYA